MKNFWKKIKNGSNSGFTYNPKKELWQAVLPDQSVKYFEEFIAKDYDCGFKLLGVTRKELVQELLSLKSEGVINDLSSDVLLALEGDLLSNFVTSEDAKRVCEDYHQYLLKRATIVSEAMAELNLPTKENSDNTLLEESFTMIDEPDVNQPNLSLENLITSLFEKESAGQLVHQLQALLSAQEKHLQNLQNLSITKEAYESYLCSLESENQWLGSKGAKLFAYARKFNLYVWRECGDFQLELMDKYQEPASALVIHVLVQVKLIPFNLLLEVIKQ